MAASAASLAASASFCPPSLASAFAWPHLSPAHRVVYDFDPATLQNASMDGRINSSSAEVPTLQIALLHEHRYPGGFCSLPR